MCRLFRDKKHDMRGSYMDFGWIWSGNAKAETQKAWGAIWRSWCWRRLRKGETLKDHLGFGVEEEGFETTSEAWRLVRRLLQRSLQTCWRACLSGWDILTL